MGNMKKGKGAGKGRGSGGKPKEGRKEPKQKEDPQRDIMVPIQERVAAVKPFWEGQSAEKRVKILTVSVDDLRKRAAELVEKQRKQAALEEQMYPGETLTIDLEPSVEEVLETGLSRLETKPTWKLWKSDDKEFLDADSFRNYMETEHIEESLRALLPKDAESKAVEKPAEAAFRTRMAELLQKVHAHNRQLQEEPVPNKKGRANRVVAEQGGHVRDTNIDLIGIIMEALDREHEFVYHAVLFPITTYICEILEENNRDTNLMDLSYEDLEKLHGDEVARICEWLTEKVDGFSSKVKPEAKDVEEEEDPEEGIGDVDLFTLKEDKQSLTVNAKWLQHLQERVLGEDGQPRKMKEGEDEFQMGLVLEWVYGTIVSTAEKARDGAKRYLGQRPPTVKQAHDQLTAALKEHQDCENRGKEGKKLLARMLESRKETSQIAQTYDITTGPAKPQAASPEETGAQDIPDSVIQAMLRREVLLTEAKLHFLDWELLTNDRKLRQLRTQLRQGEPEFERLKRELEEVKNAPRGLEGTFRSTAEMERHRAQMADAAIEEQLEVQTAFREHGAKLQGIYDQRQRTEMEIARREQEIKQLKGWKTTVQSLIDRFEELTMSPPTPPTAEGDAALGEEETGVMDDAVSAHHKALVGATRSISGQEAQLNKLRTHFQKDVRRQLYGEDDDRSFFDSIRQELKATDKKLEEGRAVLHHLEMYLVNVACDDPGASIGANLVLPLLQERLDAHAQEFAAQKSAAAQEAIIRMEEEKLVREKLEREKRQEKRQKLKERVRSEKEKASAERDAALKAEQVQFEETQRALLEKEAITRKQQAEEAELRRLAVEEEMEARRKVLMSENGYWSKRMAQDAQTKALQEESIVHPGGAQGDSSVTDATPGEPAVLKDDNDGFRDLARAPRKTRQAKGGRREEGVPEKAHGHKGGRVEEGSRGQFRQGRDQDVPKENGHVPPAHRERRGSAPHSAPHPHPEGRTLPLRPDPKLSRSNSSDKSRSGRASPVPVEVVKQHQQRVEVPGGKTLPLGVRPRAVPVDGQAQPQPQAQPQFQPQPDSTLERPRPTDSPAVEPAAEPDTQAAQEQPAQPAPQTADPIPDPTPAPLQTPIVVEEVSSFMEVPQPQTMQPPPHPTEPAGPAPVPSEGDKAYHAPPQQPESLPHFPQQRPQEERQPVGLSEAQPSTTGREELAPGTPAQQSPPVVSQVATPNGKPLFVFPDPRTRMPPGSVAHMMVQTPQTGRPPPPPEGYARPHSSRDDGRMRFTPAFHGPQGGQMPGPQMQTRGVRPHAGMPRSADTASHQQGGFPRGAFPRGAPPPPGAPSGAGQFTMPGGMMPPPPHGASPRMPDGSEPIPSSQMMPQAYVGPHGQPQPGVPPIMYPGQPLPGRHMGGQPPSMVFVGNMVGQHPPQGAHPPYGMHQMHPHAMLNNLQGGAMPLHSAPPPPQPGQPLSFPAAPYLRGSPRPHQPPQPASHSPQQGPGVHGMSRANSTSSSRSASTALRATAPSFVPGGTPSRASSAQPHVPTRPHTEGRHGMPHGGEASSAGIQELLRLHNFVPAVPAPQIPAPLPNLSHLLDPRSVPQAPQLHHPEQALEAASSSQQGPASTSSQPQDLSARQQSPQEASTTAPAGRPQPPMPEQLGHVVTPNSTQPRPQSILTRPGPNTDAFGTSEATSRQASPSPASQQVPATQSERGAPSGQAQPQPPKWSSVAAQEKPGGPPKSNMRKVGSAEPLHGPSSSPRLGAASPKSRTPKPQQPQQQQQQHQPQGTPTPNGGLHTSPSNTSLGSRSSRVAGDKRKITQAGGVTWEGLQDDYPRLHLVRGLSNEAGHNNCFLNVIIQSLWHLRSFREPLLRMGPVAAEAKGSEDAQVLRALWNVFHTFSQPRHDLPPAASPTAGAGTASTGEEAEAKRAKREGQEDAAAAKVCQGWAVSPAGIREALCSASSSIDLSDMHDAAEVLDKIFSSLHRAEVGQAGSNEQDASLPTRVRIPAPGAPASVQNGAPPLKRGPSSLVQSLFGLDVQVPNMAEEEEEVQAVKKSKNTGGAAVGRWQEATTKSGSRQQQQQANGNGGTAAKVPKKPRDANFVEMLQFIKLYHLVPAKGLKLAYERLIGGSFEEMLKEADVAEARSPGASGGNEHALRRVTKTSDVVLAQGPKVFNLAIGWESAQAPADVIHATISALAPQLDPAGIFKSSPKLPPYLLRAIVCYFGHHYKVYALSEELNEWLLYDDSTISYIGGWKEVKASLVASRMQPNLLFYEQQ